MGAPLLAAALACAPHFADLLVPEGFCFLVTGNPAFSPSDVFHFMVDGVWLGTDVG